MNAHAMKMNPFRSPRWRCDQVMRLLHVKGNPFRLFDGNDTPIRLYHRFLSFGASARDDKRKFAECCRRYPHAPRAHSLYYSSAGELRRILEARLLTSETYSQIAERLGCDEATVGLYADLFFDVRERMNAPDWIRMVVFGPAELRSKFNRDGSLSDAQRGFLYRLFAYYGGSIALDVLIDGIGRNAAPQSPADVARWLDASLNDLVRVRATAAAAIVELNQRTAKHIIKLALSGNRKQRASGNRGPDVESDKRLLEFFSQYREIAGTSSTTPVQSNGHSNRTHEKQRFVGLA